jgi:hypothetical protein
MEIGFQDAKQIRKCAIHLGIRINTSMEYLLNIPLSELNEILEEVAEFGSK